MLSFLVSVPSSSYGSSGSLTADVVKAYFGSEGFTSVTTTASFYQNYKDANKIQSLIDASTLVMSANSGSTGTTIDKSTINVTSALSSNDVSTLLTVTETTSSGTTIVGCILQITLNEGITWSDGSNYSYALTFTTLPNLILNSNK